MGMIYPRKDNVFVADEDFVSDLPEQLDADSALLKQVFYLEVPFSDSLFGAGDIKVVQGPFTYGIGRDFNTSFYISNRQALPDLMSYTAYSSVEQPPPDILRQASQSDFQKFTHDESYSEYVRQSFLQLPTSLNPQVRQLAEELTKDIEAPYDKIVAIQQFLETRYTYSLDLEKPMTDDPLHDFLFISRSGHCEYFATAMAVMCRSIGIPARLVRGFQPGEWNDLGQFYEVRQSDSHAWVEVLFPEPRWVEFDPSPRAAADEYFNSRRSFLARMFSKRLLQLQIFWRQNVIGYNETRRLRLYGEMKEFARDLPGALAGGLGKALGGTRRTHVTILLIIMLLVSALLYPAKKLQPILAPRLRSLASRRRRGNGSAFYEKMLKVLEKRKIVKPAHLTPLEFLDLPSLRLHPKLTDIEALTDLYYQTRYGGRSLESGELASVSAMLTNIKRVNGRANGSSSHSD
jgi:transglutaminase-like putative cysteine protease